MPGTVVGPIGTLGLQPSLTVGGEVFSDLTNLIRIYGVINGSGQFTSFRKANASAGYAPSGVDFVVHAIRISWGTVQANAGQHTLTLGYASNDLGIASSTSPTSPSYLYGASADLQGAFSIASPTGVFYEEFGGLDFKVTNGNYVFINSPGAAIQMSFEIFGYEV